MEKADKKSIDSISVKSCMKKCIGSLEKSKDSPYSIAMLAKEKPTLYWKV